jgi:death-on-curing protein
VTPTVRLTGPFQIEVDRRTVPERPGRAGTPRSTASSEDAYPSIHLRAAALLPSIARNHPLIDGNKQLALAATIAFYGLNGWRLTMANDEAYELVMAVAAGELDDVEQIASHLEPGTARWS